MAEKKGAGGKPQTYDESTGRYGYANDRAKTGGAKEYRQNTSYEEILRSDLESLTGCDTISLPDEKLPRSLSARWANYDILMPDGTYAHFQEGSKLHHKEVFAGKGCKRKIDNIEKVSKLFPNSLPEDIEKVKAIGTIVTEDGEVLNAEIHWYQVNGERDEHKVKRIL